MFTFATLSSNAKTNLIDPIANHHSQFQVNPKIKRAAFSDAARFYFLAKAY